MKRTISAMVGKGSITHNNRDFIAENVNQNRVYLNICYRDENLKDVYKELFDESVERYNVGKRNDRKITNYYPMKIWKKSFRNISKSKKNI